MPAWFKTSTFIYLPETLALPRSTLRCSTRCPDLALLLQLWTIHLGRHVRVPLYAVAQCARSFQLGRSTLFSRRPSRKILWRPPQLTKALHLATRSDFRSFLRSSSWDSRGMLQRDCRRLSPTVRRHAKSPSSGLSIPPILTYRNPDFATARDCRKGN